MTRPPVEQVMMTIAEAMACRSTCARRAVGAVITTADNRILATGYNGTPSKTAHCTDQPCAGHGFASGQGLDRCEAVHAEQNALVNCTDITRAHKIYVTTLPCVSCMKLIVNTPIAIIYFRDTYPTAERSLEIWLRDPRRSAIHVE